MAVWAEEEAGKGAENRAAVEAERVSEFAAFAIPIRLGDGDAATPERIGDLIDRVITDAGRAGFTMLRATHNRHGLAIDALRADGKRRVATADGNAGVDVLNHLEQKAGSGIAIQRVDADGDTLITAQLCGREPQPAPALAGFPDRFAERVARAVDHPRGLILVADPQAVGSARTIAAIGDHHRQNGRAVLSVNSLAIADKLSLPAAVTRAQAVVPDVLLIDEIGSAESVRAGVEAAIDRLVVAGVRSGDAMGAMAQIALRKTDRFDFACVIRAVVAQRAVRRLCDACKQPVQASRSDSALLGFDAGAVVFRAVGCGTCRGTGFSGEIAAIEVVEADNALRRLIGGGGDAAIIARHAFLKSPNLGAAARELVREGLTTPAEAIRISRSDPIAA